MKSKEHSSPSNLSLPGKIVQSSGKAWNELISSEREEALNEGFNDNCGWYMRLGGLYLGPKITPSALIIGGIWGQVILLGGAYKAFQVQDWESLSVCAHFIVMIGNMMLITLNFIYFRKIVDDIFTASGARFYDYADTIDKKTKQEIETLVQEMKKKKKFSVMMFLLVVAFCACGLGIKTVSNFVQQFHVVDGEGGRLSKKHAVPFWIYGIETWPIYIVCCLDVYILPFLVTNSILGFVLPVIAFAEELIVQLLIIGVGLRNVTSRADHLYYIRFSDSEKIDESRYSICLKEVLRASVVHHKITLEMLQGFKRLLYLPLFTVMFSSAVMLCMSGFLLVSDVPLIAKAVSIIFAVAEIIYSFLFCSYGENITQASEDIGDQLYQSRWIQTSQLIKPYMTMIKLRSRQPVQLTGGGILEVNIPAFSNVMRSSYSYMNIMWTSSKSQ